MSCFHLDITWLYPYTQELIAAVVSCTKPAQDNFSQNSCIDVVDDLQPPV